MANQTVPVQTTTEPGLTATALLALTTPFVQPTSCGPIWDLTRVTTITNGSVLTVTIAASNPANPLFTSCQPSGWATDLPARHFRFSPAVCPAGWVYWNLQATSSIDNHASTVSVYSTALCCDVGYSPASQGYGIPSITAPCTRSISAGDRSTVTATVSSNHAGTTTTTTAVTDALLMHEAWHISWRAQDANSLSPSPPALISGQVVQSWAPGETLIPDDNPDEGSNSAAAANGAKWFAIIGLPILAAAVVAGVVWCKIAGRRIRRQGVTRGVVEGGEGWI